MKIRPEFRQLAMVITIIIIVALLLCFSRLIVFFTRNLNPSLTFSQAALFLCAKIVAGSLYGFIYGRFYHGDDTWGLNSDSFQQYKRLLKSPAGFFGDFFATSNPLDQLPNVYMNPSSYTERLEYLIITKIMAPFNSISQGNYYINLVFFNFIGFWGVYLLYKLLAENTSSSRQGIRLLVFLFPPFLFWSSGIRTEGFLLLFTALSLYAFTRVLKAPAITNIAAWMLALLTVFIMRSSFFVVLVPCFACWWISTRTRLPPLAVFGGGFGLLAVIVLSCNTILPPAFNPLRVLAERQQEFLSLHGNTRSTLPVMDGSAGGLLRALPYAVVNSFVKPLPWEARGLLQWMVVLENIFFWALVMIALIRYPRAVWALRQQPLWVSLFFVGVLNYIITGLIVPFPGAIVRYRIIPEIFILAIAVSGARDAEIDISKKINVINFK